MNSNQKTNEGIKKNQELDEILMSTKLISLELQNSFLEAYNYDSATPYYWLVSKLKIIKERLDKNDEIELEGSKEILNKGNYREWITSKFPFAQKDLF